MKNDTRPAKARQQLLIDHDVQGAVLQRVIFYSGSCIVYFLVMLFWNEANYARRESWQETVLQCIDVAAFWAPGFVLLVPVIAYDILSVTNRFAGPIHRLRREMRQLADGQNGHDIKFRDDDYWADLADIYNDLRKEVVKLRETGAARSAEEQGPVRQTLFAKSDASSTPELASK